MRRQFSVYRSWLVTFSAFVALALTGGIAGGADFSIQKKSNKHIDIKFNDRPLARVQIANDPEDRAHETYKVFTHVASPTSSDGPDWITKGPRGKYSHHRGVFIGFSNTKVEGADKVDAWHMKNVRQEFRRVVYQRATDQRVRLVIAIDWLTPDQKLLAEWRTIVVHRPESDKSFAIDQASTLKAVAGDTKLGGDPEHAGYQFRANQAVAENKSAKYRYADKIEDIRKARNVPWTAMSFTIDDQPYTVQHMSHPTLPGKTRYSAYRNYGRFGVFFTDSLDQGETATYRIRLHISSGSFSDNGRAQMRKRYQAYVK